MNHQPSQLPIAVHPIEQQQQQQQQPAIHPETLLAQRSSPQTMPPFSLQRAEQWGFVENGAPTHRQSQLDAPLTGIQATKLDEHESRAPSEHGSAESEDGSNEDGRRSAESSDLSAVRVSYSNKGSDHSCEATDPIDGLGASPRDDDIEIKSTPDKLGNTVLIAHMSRQSMRVKEERKASMSSSKQMYESSSQKKANPLIAKLHMAQDLLQDIGLSKRLADQRHVRDAWERSERSISVLVSCLERYESSIKSASQQK